MLNVSDDSHLTGAMAQQLTLMLLGSVAYLRGDFNLDGQLTAADIPAMLAALTDLNAYQSQWNLSDNDLLAIGDLNQSGAISNADVQPELDLISGSSSLAAVPEPASWLLLLFGVFFGGHRAAIAIRPRAK
jgi:hypothetical protein